VGRDDEAKRILELCSGDALEAYQLIDKQLGVLVTRAQTILSLSGIVITVTGFSGRAIAATNMLAKWSVVAGLCVVLLGAAVGIVGVLRLRWLSQALGGEPLAMLDRALEMRDQKSRSLAVALLLFVLGFSLYVLAVAQLLVAA
jgi:hypothetical protein